MSEPKWLIKTMPSKEGFYFQENPSGVVVRMHMTGEAGGQRASCDYYGPIPEKPKAPPKIRRFTATHEGESISGFMLETKKCPFIYHWWSDGSAVCKAITVPVSELDDVVWLDPED